MDEIHLTATAWDEMSRHAEDAFPEECCGVIVRLEGQDQVHRCTNIQNKLHALDPQTYPRDATIAYAMDFNELDAIITSAEQSGARVKAFYHSHPGHEAYFSDEDRAFACPFGEATYPDAAQIVISIYHRAVKEMCAYAWSEARKDFIQIAVTKSGRR